MQRTQGLNMNIQPPASGNDLCVEDNDCKCTSYLTKYNVVADHKFNRDLISLHRHKLIYCKQKTLTFGHIEFGSFPSLSFH